MAVLKDWLIQMADGESIDAVQFGEDWPSTLGDLPKLPPPGYILSWDEAQPWLSYEFDNGFGVPGCQAVYAYTRNWIMFIAQYDGSTWPHRIPRVPTPGFCPEMPGG